MTTRPARPPHIVGVVLAAGRSERLADPVPKPFRLLAGRRMLDYSLDAFAEVPIVASIVVVVPASLRDSMEASLLSAPKVRAVAAGGPSRQESLDRGLACIPVEATMVMVHDAARPFVTPGIIERVSDGVSGGFDGAIAAIPVDDAIKEVGAGGEIQGPRSRVGLWRAQTPQAFDRDCLEASLARTLAAGVICDDCSEMVTGMGYRVRVVPGDPRNIKVTRPDDFDLCERLLASSAVTRAAP